MPGESNRSKRRSLRRGSACRWGTAAIAATLLCTPASATAVVSRTDVAATHAYLQAHYDFYLAYLRNAPAARAAVEAVGDRIGAECKGVLAGEPRDELSADLGLPVAHPPTPRESGERERSARQRATIDEETLRATDAAGEAVQRPAFEAFAVATSRLVWSDTRIAPQVRSDVARLQESSLPAPPDACADMKAWAGSGYRLLSPASRAFAAAEATNLEPFMRPASVEQLLKPYEGPAEHALVRKTHALLVRIAKAAFGQLDLYSRLQRVLGVPESRSEQKPPPPLGHGKTRAGSTFTVRARKRNGSGLSVCAHAASVEFEVERGGGGLLRIAGGSTESVCLGGKHDSSPQLHCLNDEEAIAVATPSRVRTGRLRLSDGSTIDSRVVRVPRKDGGPAGVYVQAIRDGKGRPVSLEELDRDGRLVRSVPLHGPRCKREQSPIGPKFVPLVHGTAPGGRRFTIEGEIVVFPHQRRSFSLNASAGFEDFGQNSVEASGFEPGRPKAFSRSQKTGCLPRPFALVYGILAPPGDSVLARTPEGLVPLTKQELAPSLKAGGALAYGAFEAVPTELIVRRADGSTLYTESLVAKAKEAAEFCEGFAEP